MKIFDDRVDAGRQLAQRLDSLRGQDVVVLGLPRGGVPVAFEVAKALRAPLDVLVVRKLGVPFQPELAFDEVVCLQTPAAFFAVGQGYRNFTQTSDDEVITLLDRAWADSADKAAIAAADPPLRDEEVQVAAGPVSVVGHLTIPENARGIVVFAHGSGSSRHSPRNRYVAEVLHGAGLATLLFDLLTPAEERNRANVFDIELLASRLVDVTGWLATQPDVASLPVGYFGASTGAGAALVAAADPRVKVGAVVSRGGRPDLAGRSLTRAGSQRRYVGERSRRLPELGPIPLASARRDSTPSRTADRFRNTGSRVGKPACPRGGLARESVAPPER